MADQPSSPELAPVPTPQQEHETKDVPATVKEEPSGLPFQTTDVTPPSKTSSSSPGRNRTVAQRRAALRDDPLAGEVEPHRVYCRGCGKWIKLSSNNTYCTANWKAHVQRCHSDRAPRPLRRTPSKPTFSPESRVATAERKILLFNDPQAKSFSTERVHCRACKTVVELEGVVDYDLTRWAEHKEQCIPKPHAPVTPQGSRACVFPPPSTSSTHSQISAGGSARSPSPTPPEEGLSNQSTETTAVPDGSPPAVTIGVKRARDEDEGAAKDADERPTVRPRKDAPSLVGLLVRPFKEFARGFREGLYST